MKDGEGGRRILKKIQTQGEELKIGIHTKRRQPMSSILWIDMMALDVTT